MMSFPAQVWMNVRILFRIPISVFFTVAFPPLMLVIMMTTLGNPDIGGGLHLSDKYLLIATGMGLVPLAFITFPLWICSSYESSFLIRLKYFHVSLFRMALSSVIAHVCVALCGVAVNIVVGVLFYQVAVPGLGYFLMYVGEVLIVLLSLMAFGCALGFIVRQTAVVMSLGLILMFLVYMLCGAFGNYDSLPESLQHISELIPLKYLMIDGFDVWSATGGITPQLVVLSAVWIVVSSVVAFFSARRGPKHGAHHARMEVQDELETS